MKRTVVGIMSYISSGLLPLQAGSLALTPLLPGSLLGQPEIILELPLCGWFEGLLPS